MQTWKSGQLPDDWVKVLTILCKDNGKQVIIGKQPPTREVYHHCYLPEYWEG